MPDIEITGKSGMRTVPGYLARPLGAGPWPGVIVVHDIFGLGDDMREQADWLATAGYLALVPDLYSRGGMVRCVQGVFKALKAGHGTAFVEIEQARGWLAGQPGCTGTTGVIGYCLGGAFALLLAPRPGWDAAAVNYGELPDDLDAVLSASCPMVASFGGKDRALKGAAPKLEAALSGAGVAHDVKEYPDAGHGFLNRIAVRSPLTLLLKVAGVGYDHTAAADAKRRILEFFGEHLAAGGAAGPVSPGAEPAPAL